MSKINLITLPTPILSVGNTRPLQKHIVTVAENFCVLMRQELDEGEIQEVNKRNAELENWLCESHDFCDPNMVMIDTINQTFQITNEDWELDGLFWSELMDNTWNLAKLSGFSLGGDNPSEILVLDEEGMYMCSECNLVVDNYNMNKYDKVVCNDCGVKSHCFCDDCGEFVPTSEVVVYDGVNEVNSANIEETKVLCDGCNWESE